MSACAPGLSPTENERPRRTTEMCAKVRKPPPHIKSLIHFTGTAPAALTMLSRELGLRIVRICRFQEGAPEESRSSRRPQLFQRNDCLARNLGPSFHQQRAMLRMPIGFRNEAPRIDSTCEATFLSCSIAC